LAARFSFSYVGQIYLFVGQFLSVHGPQNIIGNLEISLVFFFKSQHQNWLSEKNILQVHGTFLILSYYLLLLVGKLGMPEVALMSWKVADFTSCIYLT
jgi:hypothetical protein